MGRKVRLVPSRAWNRCVSNNPPPPTAAGRAGPSRGATLSQCTHLGAVVHGNRSLNFETRESGTHQCQAARQPAISALQGVTSEGAASKQRKRHASMRRHSLDRTRAYNAAHSGAAVVATFIVGGSSMGVCDFPATQASIMSAHSCSM